MGQIEYVDYSQNKVDLPAKLSLFDQREYADSNWSRGEDFGTLFVESCTLLVISNTRDAISKVIEGAHFGAMKNLKSVISRFVHSMLDNSSTNPNQLVANIIWGGAYPQKTFGDADWETPEEFLEVLKTFDFEKIQIDSPNPKEQKNPRGFKIGASTGEILEITYDYEKWKKAWWESKRGMNPKLDYQGIGRCL